MKKIKYIIVVVTLASLITACNKKDYYKDSGVLKGNFNGTVMQYLNSKPEYFDSLVQIISLAGMENELNANNITFFAPTDSSIRASIRFANIERDFLGMPRISKLSEIKPAIWRKHLSKYLFNFKRSLNDFSQIDFSNINTYSGQIYQSVNGTSMNIGVIYNDVSVPSPRDPNISNVIKYAGYRQLTISYLTSPFTPRETGTWRVGQVSSVNVEPNNGFVHILRTSTHIFGFDVNQFSDDVAYFND